MKYYRYDTHVHTKETSMCGQVEAKRMVQLYKEAGYDGIIITDHYNQEHFDRYRQPTWEQKVEEHLKGYKAAVEEGKRLGIKVLLGIELRFVGSLSDYLIYGVDEEFLKKNRELYKGTLQSFYESVQGKEIMIFQAHPYRKGSEPALPQYLHGVEVLNAHPRHDSRNDLAMAFAQKYNLLMSAGSDAHQEEDAARSGLLLPERIESSAELVKLFRENAVLERIRNYAE